jgi:hypothetical protein
MGLTLNEANLWNASYCSNLEGGRVDLSHGKGEGVLVRGEDARVDKLLDFDGEVRKERLIRKPNLSFLSFFLSRMYRSSDIRVTFVGELLSWLSSRGGPISSTLSL